MKKKKPNNEINDLSYKFTFRKACLLTNYSLRLCVCASLFKQVVMDILGVTITCFTCNIVFHQLSSSLS